MTGNEDRLGVVGGEVRSCCGSSCLKEEGGALRRRVDDVSCIQGEVFALVVDLPDLVGVDVGVCLRVGGEGVGGPGAFP